MARPKKEDAVGGTVESTGSAGAAGPGNPVTVTGELPKLKFKTYKPEDLLKLFDELIFQGEYSEEVIIRGRLKVRFRTRSAEETMEISRALDDLEYKLLPTMQEQRAFLNISKSLISYQGRDLTMLPEGERTKFIKKLPTSILSAISDELGEFDRKVDLACREAEENF